MRKNRFIPANPSFSIEVGFKGVYFSWTCFPDVSKKSGILAFFCKSIDSLKFSLVLISVLN